MQNRDGTDYICAGGPDLKARLHFLGGCLSSFLRAFFDSFLSLSFDGFF